MVKRINVYVDDEVHKRLSELKERSCCNNWADAIQEAFEKSWGTEDELHIRRITK